MPLLIFNRKLNDSINDTVDERSRHLSRLIFTNFCLAKLQDGKLFRHSPFVLLSVSILDWFMNIYPTRPRKQQIKVKFVKPVKTTTGTKSVLGYSQQTITEP